MATNVELAANFINGVAAISSVIQTYLAVRLGKTLPESPGEMTHRPGVNYSAPDGVDELANVIDERLLKTMNAIISSTRAELLLALDDQNKTQTQKDRSVEKASKAICGELRRIRRLNEDNLPSTCLERAWRSYGCESRE